MDNPEQSTPPHSAQIALAGSSSLCAQAPSRQAHADIRTSTPIDRTERANKWVVLALSGMGDGDCNALQRAPMPYDLP